MNDSPVEHRTLFLYLESKYFTVENLEKIFRHLGTEFAQPEYLDICAYSDKAIVRMAIYDHLTRRCYRVDSSFLEKLREQFEAEYNFKKGTMYHAASYYRNAGREEYSYDMNPYEQGSIKVTLKHPPARPGYTGDLDSDFMHSAKEGDTVYVESFLGNGANINARDENGDTALMHAALHGHMNIVMILLQKGADINARDGDGVTALMRAARTGHTVIVRELLARRVDVNARDRSLGMTALMSSLSYPGITELLLEAGADIDATDNLGHSALMLAAGSGNATTVDVLLSKAADINARNREGKTALSYAKTYAKPADREVIIQLLEKAGAQQ